MNLSRFGFVSLLALALTLTVPMQTSAQEDSDTPTADVNTARLQVKFSQLEEQIRKLQGMVEQVSYDNRQIKAQIDKSNSDVDFRLDALEKAQQAAPQQQPAQQNPDSPQSDSGKLHPVEAAAPAESNTPEPIAPLPKFPNSRAHYNYAFKLLNQGDKYAEAGNAFAAFTKAYPKDPLIGNAYYWLGETYYVRRDYVKAADNFRQGYEAMPTGPKAADNLLNLAKSLNAIKKPKEACIVLKQVVVKFGSSSNSMKSRAEQDMNTFGCNN